MRLERRILLEAVIVSVLGHAVFFSVFVVKETEAAKGAPRMPTVVSIAQFEGLDVADSRITANPAASDPDLPEHVALQRRTTMPKLELDRTTFLWEDEPELTPPAPQEVGPSTWGFAKEPGLLRDEFPADYDAGPSLEMARGALGAGGDAEAIRPIPFRVAFKKMPGAGALMISPDKADGEDIRFITGEIRYDAETGKFDVLARPSGDPQIDAAIMSRVPRWQFKLVRTSEGYQLRARLPLPASMRVLGPVRRPPTADDLLDNGPAASGGAP